MDKLYTKSKGILEIYLKFFLILIFSFLALAIKSLIKNEILSNIFTVTYILTYYFLFRFNFRGIINSSIEQINSFFYFEKRLKISSVLVLLLTLSFSFIVGNNQTLVFVLTLVFSSLFTAIIEELIFRYVLIVNYFMKTPFVLIQIIISSLIFSMLHVFSDNPPIYLFYTFLMGVLFGLIFIIYKRIWLNIIIHTSINILGGLIKKLDNDIIYEYSRTLLFIVPIVLIPIFYYRYRRRLFLHN